ncbi:MAG: mechanosensitive ion channel family protein [Deltaproteobacteria bacterium]|nr:mechanosensitive ion channel family protein [Deltaproteobacteria bacterium]
MQLRRNIVSVFLCFSIILLTIAPWGVQAQNPPAGEVSPKTVDTQAKNDTDPSPKKIKTVDKAGESIGKGLDQLSDKASSKIRKMPEDGETLSWRQSFLQALSKPLSLFIWSYGIYGALSPLYVHFLAADGSNLVHSVAQKAADIGGIIALFWFFLLLIGILDIYLKKWAVTTESTLDDMLVPIVGKTLRLFIVVIGGIIVVQNLTGLKIGPLLASLGIGGLAVALAAKDSIANFFGTITILFDKPFQVGQRITIDRYDGIVENVGFRSTRIRTLTGHLVTIPNEKLVNSSLENIGERPYIRWLTNIGITYDTPPDKVEKAVQILEKTLENHEGMKDDFPPRVFFNGFNDWSLNILVIAWYHPPDYWAFQAWLQKTCLQLLREFEAEDIDFAFPSRTLYMANDDKRQLKLMMLRGQQPDLNID